MVMIKLYLEI